MPFFYCSSFLFPLSVLFRLFIIGFFGGLLLATPWRSLSIPRRIRVVCDFLLECSFLHDLSSVRSEKSTIHHWLAPLLLQRETK